MSELTMRQLEYLTAISSTGSIAGAASECQVSQSAVSVALGQLERHLGATLVVRGPGRPTAVTPQGQAAVEHAQRILSMARHLSDEVMQSGVEMRGRLRIGVYRTLSPRIVPDVIEQFLRHHPYVALDIVEDSGPAVLRDLMAGRIDVGFLGQAQVDKGFDTVVVRDASRRLVLSPRHPLARETGPLLPQLAEHPGILLDEEPSLTRTLEVFEAAGVTPSVAFRSGNIETILNVVGRNIAWGLLLEGTDISPEGQPLLIRDLGHVGFRNPLVAATPPGVVHSPLVTAAVQAVQSAAPRLT